MSFLLWEQQEDFLMDKKPTYDVQRQLFLPVGDNYFSPLPLVNEGRDGE